MLKKSHFLIICSGLLLFTFTSANAATDWGTKGVSDTAKVKNIIQITDDSVTSERKTLGGRSWPPAGPNSLNAWSQDGKWVVFTAQVGGTSDTNEEICKIKPDGTGFTQLTNNAVSDSNANFGSDGKIYFTRYLGNPDYRDEVWRIDSNGDNPTNLSAAHSETTNSEQYPIVSPDGTKVAYVKNGLLYVAPSDGTSETKVSGQQAGPSDLTLNRQYTWSPDSTKIAFSSYSGTGNLIFIVKSDGSDANKVLTPLVPQVASTNLYWPEWSPDGTRIAYIHNYNYGETQYLRVVTIDGNTDTSYDSASNTASPGWYSIEGPLGWNPDSNWLAYSKRYYESGSNDVYALFMVDTSMASPTPVQLTKDYTDFTPVWSPVDSQMILFQSQGSASPSYPTREDPTNGDTGDLLIINLIKKFNWPMFIPAATGSGN